MPAMNSIEPVRTRSLTTAGVSAKAETAPGTQAQHVREALPAPSRAPAATSVDALVPANFGAPNGPGVTNGPETLDALFSALGARKQPPRTAPPALIYLFVEPYNTAQITSNWGLGPNGFGHAAVAYTLDGKTELMNIKGSGNPAMVNFVPLSDYLFNTHEFSNACEQGGLYNRSMRMVFFWDVPEANLRAMKRYYEGVKADSEKEVPSAHFSIAQAPLLNAMSTLKGSENTYGNCSIYTSRGLREAGIVDSACMWPKELFIRLMKQRGDNPENVSVVSLPRIKHAQMTLGKSEGNAGLVGPSLNPAKWMRYNFKYWRLENFADAEVVVPKGSTEAHVRLRGIDANTPALQNA